MERKSIGLALFGLVVVTAVSLGVYVLIRDADGGERDVLVEYTRSGGFTGTIERLKLFADGTAVYRGSELGSELDRASRYAVQAGLVRRLESRLDRALAADVDEFTRRATCADCFQYDIMYRGRRYIFFDLLDEDHPISDAVGTLNRVMSKAPQG